MQLPILHKRWWRFGLISLAVFWMTAVISGFTTPVSAQAAFRDVQGHWAQPCIEALAQRQIISGYPDGTFRPSASVTRAEFAAMVRRAFPNAPQVRSAANFGDVPANYWASAAIQEAYQKGFLSGYPGQVFNPTQPIPRVQVLVSLASGLKYAPTQPATATLSTTFDDSGAIPTYAQTAIAAATEQRLVVNYPNVRSLNPNRLATRAEVAAFFCQAGLIPSGSPIPSQYIAGATISNTNAELRGVWLTNIDSDVLFSRDRLSNALQTLAQLNFNTVYPTVWNWGYTLYPSQVAERVIGRSLDPEPGLQGRDMLNEAVTQGHRRGMGVIPWFEFGFMAPADSALAKRHPEWITSRRDGTQIVKEGQHDRVWLNPFHPEVQQFILDLVAEVVGNYAVDGIQFDDHFGLPAELGYDAYTVKLYQQEHQGQRPPVNPQDPEWLRWRANKITDFMTRVFETVKARNKSAIVSVSPNPLEFAYQFYLQDWQTWERRGLVEELIVQIYRTDFSRFLAELDRPEMKAARSHIPVGIGILAGLKNRLSSVEQIQTQVQAARGRGFAGVSFFFYETMWNGTGQVTEERRAAFQALFPKPIPRPKVS